MSVVVEDCMPLFELVQRLGSNATFKQAAKARDKLLQLGYEGCYLGNVAVEDWLVVHLHIAPETVKAECLKRP